MDGKASIVIGKANLGVVADFPVCVIKRTAPDSCRTFCPERGLSLLPKCLNEEGLHHAVDPQDIQILNCSVVASRGASRANWRTTRDFSSFDQGKSYQNPQRVG